MSAGIFLSYRRKDAGGHAGRLYDRLSHWFDADALFYDRESIDAGQEFPQRLAAGIQGAAVVLVLLGPDWLEEINRRAEEPGVDFVRREVELALTRRRQDETLLVMPVLLGEAAMPDPRQLHASLRSSLAPLWDLDAHVFQGKQADWENQFVRLRERLARAAGLTLRFRAPAGATPPFRVIDHSVSPHFQDPHGLLARLHEQLAESGRAAVLAPAALYGMGGVGKTQLALKYSHDYRDLHAGVWWFRAETATTLEEDALACRLATGAPSSEGETPAAALRRWLEAQTAPWLLVYDNAEAVEALRPHLPQRGPHRLLITSRNPAWGGVARPLEVAIWTPEQSAEFLAARLPQSHQADRLALASDLGGLPLALEQAASYLEETATPIPDYRQLLHGVDTEGLILDEGRAATGYERSLAAALSLAFEKLSPAAAQLLRLCAYAAPEPLPERFFHEAAEHLPEPLAEVAAAPLVWNRVVGELIRYGLAQRPAIPALERGSDAATETALVLHRLTQQVVRSRLAQVPQDPRSLQAVLLAVCPRDTNLPENWPRLASLAAHVDQLYGYVDRGWLDNRRHSWLLDRVASYFQDGPALYAAAVERFRRALALDSQDLGEEHPDTLTRMNNLAHTLWRQGDLPGARALQEQVLALRRRILGEEHPDTLTSMSNLAITLWSQGDLPGARPLKEQVLALRRRLLGEEHPDTLSSMNNLANTLADQGDLPGARALEEQVLAIRRRVLGEEHPATLTSMNNLASTLWRQGDLPGAHALQEQVLAIQRRVLGEEHPDTLSSMNNLASTLWDLGERNEACRLMQAAAEDFAKTLGFNHPKTQVTINNVETMQRRLSDLSFFDKYLAQYIEKPDPPSPE